MHNIYTPDKAIPRCLEAIIDRELPWSYCQFVAGCFEMVLDGLS